MAEDFLAQFMGDHNRARLLRVFAFNQGSSYTLTEAAKRAGVVVKIAEDEIRSLEKLDIIREGKITLVIDKKESASAKHKEHTWTFNNNSTHGAAISKFVYEVSPRQYGDVVVAIRRSGKPTAVILSGCFMGDPTRPADLIVAADALNEQRLDQVVRGLEPLYGREIRYAAFSTPEFRYRLTIQDRLIRDTLDFPHLVLLDKTRML
jgi:hypothetical protein